MSTPTHDEILRALTAYCERHLASRHNWQNTYGLTCDETGCSICNGEGAAQTAAWWLEAYESGPIYDEDGYQTTATPICRSTRTTPKRWPTC